MMRCSIWQEQLMIPKNKTVSLRQVDFPFVVTGFLTCDYERMKIRGVNIDSQTDNSRRLGQQHVYSDIELVTPTYQHALVIDNPLVCC